jgi:small GTP-binding protein
VGKSSICDRFIYKSFKEQYDPTVGIDYKNKISEEKDSLININCWDISGDENYLDIRNEFYKDSFAIFIVFDLQYKRTFDNVLNWAKEATESGAKEGSFFLVGNKAEDKTSRVVKDNEAN